MTGRPLKLPGHRPFVPQEETLRPGDKGPPRRTRSAERRHPLARCLSRGRQPPAPPSRAVLDAAALREAALRRLQRLAESVETAADPGEVRKELVDALLHCRAVSLDLVEAFDRWRISGRRGGMTLDPHYLVHMKDDTRWLAESPLADFLQFSDKSDPFFVVPSSKEPRASPSNPMTATLQAKLRAKQSRGAQLPLQAPLLRRIRKAELVIMKESMQARLSQVERSRPASALGQACEDARPPVQQVAYAPTESSTAEAVAPRPKPSRAVKLDLGAYMALPWNVPESAARELFERYIQRVPEALVKNTDTWQALELCLSGSGNDRPVRGPLALEFFWLKRKDPDSDGLAPTAETADGLCVFQLLRSGGKAVGQLRHFSVLSLEIFEEALTSVKNLMFARLPIVSIRYVIWCRETGEDGKLRANDAVEEVLKKLCFRWFRFENNKGERGKEMNRPRNDADPALPLEVPSLEICVGQVWLRGVKAPKSKAWPPYSGNLALAAGCLRALRGKDEADAPPPESLLDAATALAWARCKKTLQSAVFSGHLDRLLQQLGEPPRLENEKSKDTGDRSHSGLTCRMVQQMEEGLELPEVTCQAVCETAELVRRGLSQAALRQAADGLRTENMPETLAQYNAKDGAFGRMVLALEWQHVNMLDETTFEVPVVAAARSFSHPHPLMYLSTSDEGIYVVIVPFQGISVKDEDFYTFVTHLLRDATPLDPSPIASVQLFNFDARQAVRASHVDASPLQMGAGSLHVMDFSSASVNCGRWMPGKLSADVGDGQRFALQRPFALCLWHSDMDELNAPLFATMVK